MSRVEIGNIAGKLVILIRNDDEFMSVELTVSEAIQLAEIFDVAIFKAANGEGIARSFREFMEAFEGE